MATIFAQSNLQVKFFGLMDQKFPPNKFMALYIYLGFVLTQCPNQIVKLSGQAIQYVWNTDEPDNHGADAHRTLML